MVDSHHGPSMANVPKHVEMASRHEVAHVPILNQLTVGKDAKAP